MNLIASLPRRWAMHEPDRLRLIAAAATLDPSAISARRLEIPGLGGEDDDSPPRPPGYMVRPDRPGVAILPVMGPIFRADTPINDFMAWAFGGTILDRLALAFQDAADAPDIDEILLHVNSPGGEADGLTELARRIRAANDGAGSDRPPKRVTGYADTLCCSAGYYLASAAGELVAGPNSEIGCIGTITVMYDLTEMLEKAGIKEFVIRSSDAPNKWPDPKTERGMRQIQDEIDGHQEPFRRDVASFRNVSEVAVMEDFGGGGILSSDEAVKVGMVDRKSDFESVLAALSARAAESRRARLEAARNPSVQPYRPAARAVAAVTRPVTPTVATARRTTRCRPASSAGR